MTMPLPLDGGQLRDLGIARAETSMKIRHPETRAAADRWLIARAVRPGIFTSEDLISHLEQRGLITADQDLRWIGGVFNGAARRGIIAKAGVSNSTRPNCHGGYVGVWAAGSRAKFIDSDDFDRPISQLGKILAQRQAVRDLVRQV